jgi:malic enzyme
MVHHIVSVFGMAQEGKGTSFYWVMGLLHQLGVRSQSVSQQDREGALFSQRKSKSKINRKGGGDKATKSNGKQRKATTSNELESRQITRLKANEGK